VDGLLSLLFQIVRKSASTLTSLLPVRPLLPETFYRTSVVEGSIRSLHRALIVLLLFAPLSPLFSDARVSVVMHDHVTVPKAVFFLGDIAKVQGGDASLRERLVGLKLGSVADIRIVSHADVLAHLRRVSIESDRVSIGGAPLTRISIAMQCPDPEEISRILRTHLASVTDWEEAEIEVCSIDNLESMKIPSGDAELRIVGHLSPSSSKSILFPLETVLEGRSFQTFWIRARIRVQASVVRVTNPIPYRKPLQPADLEEAVCEIQDLRAHYFRSVDDVSGLVSKRALYPGDMLNQDWVTERELVRRGDTVRLRVQGKRISISTLARALQSGKLGDRIRVKNIDTNRAVRALVIGKGEVRVQF